MNQNTDLTCRQRAWRWRIFFITWIAYAGFYLCRRNFSVAMPILASELHFSNMQLAKVIFGYSLCYSLGQFCFGSLADRFGSRMMVSFGFCIVILANVFIGVYPSLVALTVLSCMNGLGQSAGWPGLVKNIAPWFRHSERGVVMGWWSTNYVIGGFIATVFAVFVLTNHTLAVHWGWRRGFWFPAMLVVAMALVYALWVRNRPEDAGLPPIDDEPLTVSAMPAGDSANLETPRLSAWHMLADMQVWALAIGCAFSKIIRYSLLYWLPLYMTEHLHYTPSQAGYTASLYEFVGFGGALAAGYISDKLMHSRRMPVVSIMFWGLGLACWLHPQMAALGPIGVAVSVAVIGIMNYGPDTLLQGASSQDVGAKWGVGKTSGMISGVGSLGQLISPFLVAYVTQKYGWDSLFYWFVAISLFAGALLATQWRREVYVHCN
jgi:sugar phosphate permease